MSDAPFDIYELDEIVVFDGDGDLIEFYRDGKYIYLEKPSKFNVKYRFNLQTSEFERLNFYKTTEDKITKVEAKNMYPFFRNCKLVTKDLHFGRLVIFAKYNRSFERFSSPLRFIEQLGSSLITNIEKWESLGFVVEEMEYFFGEFQIRRTYSGELDTREDIFKGTVTRDYRSFYRGIISYGPQDFSKSLLQHLKAEYKKINNNLLRNFKHNYNEGEDIIEDDLLRLSEDPEFGDCFDYTSTSYPTRDREKNLLMEDKESFDLRMELIQLIKTYHLDLESVARWIKRQRNVEKNDIIFLLQTGHYKDYLRCEFELKNASYSNMVKYPKNFRTEFHKVQMEYTAKKAIIDRRRFERLCETHKNLTYKNKKFFITIPKVPEEIEKEADGLKHCVRTYIEPMSEGRTLILFLRKVEEPDVPYVTLEVKNNTLKQAYGENDSKPEPEALEFLHEWLEEKKIVPGCWSQELSKGIFL